MKKARKILIIGLCFGLIASFVSGCGTKDNRNSSESDSNDSVKSDNNDSTETEEPETSFLDDNKSYFFSIDGQKFYAGDDISSLSAVGYTVPESEADEELPAGKYMIGAGHMENANGDSVFDITPYNPTDASVKVSESVIGGFSTSYVWAKDDETALNIEIYGGIKIGSTKEEVETVFGEPTSISESSMGSTYYIYESDEVYRSYKIQLNSEGTVEGFEWKNLVFHE